MKVAETAEKGRKLRDKPVGMMRGQGRGVIASNVRSVSRKKEHDR